LFLQDGDFFLKGADLFLLGLGFGAQAFQFDHLLLVDDIIVDDDAADHDHKG
jgi:hypothetical protein